MMDHPQHDSVETSQLVNSSNLTLDNSPKPTNSPAQPRRDPQSQSIPSSPQPRPIKRKLSTCELPIPPPIVSPLPLPLALPQKPQSPSPPQPLSAPPSRSHFDHHHQPSLKSPIQLISRHRILLRSTRPKSPIVRPSHHQLPNKRPRNHHPNLAIITPPTHRIRKSPESPPKPYRATSLPPASPTKKRRKDENLPINTKLTKSSNSRASSRPTNHRGGPTRKADRTKTTLNQQPLLTPLSTVENHTFAPILSHRMITSSDNNLKKPKPINPPLPAVYRSRPAQEFRLPTTAQPTAPVYVQLIARHTLDLPRISAITTTTNSLVHHKTGLASSLYPRPIKRGLQQLSESVTRVSAVPEINLPSWIPPITRSSMAELEFVEVLKNAQLRHDIVFDDVLRFRPNLDGDRGERKRLVADRYWISISRELESNCRCTAFIQRFSNDSCQTICSTPDPRKILSCVCSGGQQQDQQNTKLALKPGTIPLDRIPSRIPPLVEELRNILLSLVAPRSPTLSHPTSTAHELICSTLDPIEISQRLESNSKIDMVGLARFLGVVLKGHCAPMRDGIVDGMVGLISGEEKEFVIDNDITNAAAHDSLMKRVYKGLAGGLRMAFELLELMKLDIANHQLRTLRPLLLETALEFEIRHFRDQLLRKPTIDRTKRWYGEALNRVRTTNPKLSSTELISTAVRDGLLELVFNPPPQPSSSRMTSWTPIPSPSPLPAPAPAPGCIPETLTMDTVRLQTLHSDLTDLTLGYMLIMLFKQLAGHSRIREGEVETLKNEIWVLLSDPNLKVKNEKRHSPGLGLKKIEIPSWREAFENVVLHVARRIECVRERDQSMGVPSPELVRRCRAWMDCHVRVNSSFLAMARDRVRSIVELVIIEGSESLPVAGITSSTGMEGKAPDVIRSGRATMIGSEEMSRRSIDEHTIPNLIGTSSSSSVPSSGAERVPLGGGGGEIWKRNGMVELEGEVCVIASRLGKLLKYHLKGYGGLYAHLHVPDHTT